MTTGAEKVSYGPHCPWDQQKVTKAAKTRLGGA